MKHSELVTIIGFNNERLRRSTDNHKNKLAKVVEAIVTETHSELDCNFLLPTTFWPIINKGMRRSTSMTTFGVGEQQK